MHFCSGGIVPMSRASSLLGHRKIAFGDGFAVDRGDNLVLGNRRERYGHPASAESHKDEGNALISVGSALEVEDVKLPSQARLGTTARPQRAANEAGFDSGPGQKTKLILHHGRKSLTSAL